ncbi:MAG: LAGLIDADG family homing endonuclease, partial [Candidatus Aenigmatarchaeota archaeon]
MEVRSDLHIHSRYAGGTSKKINVKNLEKYASKKGLTLLGTGDFTHPKWLEELKNNLHQKESGILETDTGFNFMLTTEVSNNYEYEGELRKIHNVILAPGFGVVDQINDTLKDYGKLEPVGRPTFKGMSCSELVEVLKNISEDICIIPAHIWTPWYGMFGSKSGFDSIEECFQDQTKHINALETGLSCYDSDTEILTEDGWKKFTEVSKDDKICTLNKETEEIEYQHPQRIYSYNYNGKMYRIKTKRVDLLVTPNHKLAIKKYTGSAGYRKAPPIELIRADERIGTQKVFKKDGVWIGEKRKYFTLPEVKIPHGSRNYSGTHSVKEKLLPIEPWLKFFGLWLADGHTSPSIDGAYPVVVSNNNESLLEEIKEALERMGFNPYFGQNRIRVRNYQLWKYLKKLGKEHEKWIPKNIKKLSTDLLQIFFDYYIKGDGQRYGRNNKGLQATTTSPQLRDDLQEIALKLGMSAYWKHTVKPGEHTLPGDYKNRRDVWDIYFIRKNEHRVYPAGVKKKDHWEEKWIDYKGKVHCVTVPNSIIYVRRNGIPVWCGNSDPAMNWRLSQLDDYTLVSFSDAHSHWPWR